MLISACIATITLAHQPVLSTQKPAIVPKPVEWRSKGGYWIHPQGVKIQAKGEIPFQTAHVMKTWLTARDVVTSGKGDIVLELDPREGFASDESYKLTVGKSGIRVVAKSSRGLHNGAVSATQLLVAARLQPKGGVPIGTIQDHPKFSWRGMHLDVSRHFFDKQQVKQYLDYLAFYKFNVFHWHLIDDGGWRLEIKKYPRLTSVGAFRASIPSWNQGQVRFPVGSSYEPKYGGYYTQADVREIVQYAKKRNITVVPEIELPGHTMPSIAAYPNLACRGYDAATYRIETGNLSSNVYCAGKEETFKFLEDVFDEVLTLFPSEVIHIGGDEVNKSLWEKCPDCQARMKAEGLKNVEELQSYFVKRIERYLTSKKRRIMGWDEILEGGLAPRASVMSWRGVEGGIEAASHGHNVVMTPTSPCYFDYTYDDNSIEKVYKFNPIPPGLAIDKQKHILGGQGNVWTEWMPRFSRVQEMIFPRMIAMSEALWTPITQRNYAEFQERLRRHFAIITNWGVLATLPAPDPSMSLVLITGKQPPVTFAPAPYDGLTLRMSKVGNPEANSEVVKSGIPMRDGEKLRVAYFDSKGRRGPIRTISTFRSVSSSAPLAPGLRVELFKGEWKRVPEFGQLTKSSTSYVGEISVGPLKGQDNYALRFTGVIRIPVSGSYTFWLGSDDGSWLKLGGATLVDNDNLHGFIWASGSVNLLAGDYPFELGFFEQGGNDDLRLEVQGPGVTRKPVPSEWLYRTH